MSSFADLLTPGHRLLKIIKIQLICSESVEHKLHFELYGIKIDAILTDTQRFYFALPIILETNGKWPFARKGLIKS